MVVCGFFDVQTGKCLYPLKLFGKKEKMGYYCVY